MYHPRVSRPFSRVTSIRTQHAAWAILLLKSLKRRRATVSWDRLTTTPRLSAIGKHGRHRPEEEAGPAGGFETLAHNCTMLALFSICQYSACPPSLDAPVFERATAHLAFLSTRRLLIEFGFSSISLDLVAIKGLAGNSQIILSLDACQT